MVPEELQVPGYDIEERIGRGGMASVYRARQHTFDRDVALKVLKPDLSEDENFCQRFVQESLIVAKLHHSNIVQVYDVGEIQNNFYIAMEYLHGGDLNAKLKKGITINETIDILKQAASALDFAHQKGIIHRDIKPDNIMFREDGAAVLTDFGIAKEVDSDINLTQTGLIVGTPKYMSPEQIRGDKAGPQADIYSLGILFFQCLTNRVPFEGKDMVSTAYKHFNDPVPALPPLVAAFQPIINRMLEKFPEDRYQRARDIINDLNKLTQTEINPNQSKLEETATFILPASKLEPTQLHDPSNSINTGKTERIVKIKAENQTQSERKFPLHLILGFSALVTIGAAVVFLQKTEPAQTNIELNPTLIRDMSPSEKSLTIRRLLDEATIDIEQKRLKKPDSNNAFNKFQRVLQIDPQQAQALAGMEQIAEEYVKLADKALQVRDYPVATQYLDDARSAAPELQLITTIERKLLEATRAKLDQQESILSMEKSLVVQGLLESARIDEEEGRLRSPRGDNAEEKYRKVLEIDPNNARALTRLEKLGNPK